MEYEIDERRIRLDQRNVIGSGGEGTVFKLNLAGRDVAAKIYEHPDETKTRKLRAFLAKSWSLPPGVASPEKLICDLKGSVVGFTMPLLPKGSEEVRNLSNRRFRLAAGITTKTVTEIFLEGFEALSKIHNQGLVVGDLNDLNVFFTQKDVFWLDVDSWQFGGFVCPVATEQFLDPTLYGIDLSKRVCFTEGSDWYSFATLLFKSLLLVHPFGGNHKSVKTVTQRARRKITVFEPGVIYPTIALAPDILNDELAGVFNKYFKEGWRGAFPQSALRRYAQSLTACTTCQTWYPQTSRTCPVCMARTLVIVTKPSPDRAGVGVSELVRTQGKVLLTRAFGDKVFVLVYEAGKAVLYVYEKGLRIERTELFNHEPGTRFELGDGILVVNPAGSSEIFVLDISGSSPKPVTKTVTEVYSPNRKAVFKASANSIFRIAGSTLLCGEVRNGKIVERPLRSVIDGQTWFTVDPSSPDPFVFGLFQVLRQQVFWMIKDMSIFEPKIPELEKGEALVDIGIKFSSQGVYVLRQTKQSGIDFLRKELVDGQGKVVFSQKLKREETPYSEIHGQVFGAGLVLHASDDGIVQEEVETGKLKVFDQTKGLVSEKDILLRSPAGLLVVKEDKVIVLTIN